MYMNLLLLLFLLHDELNTSDRHRVFLFNGPVVSVPQKRHKAVFVRVILVGELGACAVRRLEMCYRLHCFHRRGDSTC